MYGCINLHASAIVSLFIAGLTALYLYVSRNHQIFKSMGIDGPKPNIFFGSFYKFFYMTFNEILAEDYKKYGRIYGWFFGLRPVLVIGEPRLLRDICIKDFHKFVDRVIIKTGNLFDDRQLTIVNGDEWKQLRSVISPTFSSGKMRRMHPLIEDCYKSLETVLMNATNNNKEVELKKMIGNFTMDVIATCAFATKINTYNDANHPFLKHANRAASGNWKVIPAFILLDTLPKCAARALKHASISLFNTESEIFFTSAIIYIMKKRANINNNENHVDFLQLMINAKNKANSLENNEKSNQINKSLPMHEYRESQQNDKIKSRLEISDIDIIATAALFFVAGFETTASLISFLCYALAMHEYCQQKLYEELKSVEKLDYDTIASLPYLDACILETQRLYTTAGVTSKLRLASQDYLLGDTGITIPKGMQIFINIEGVHHDPEYYPNPHRFDPERFMPENRDKLVPYAFLPFGLGSRNCIAERFALMEAKTAIARMITKFKFVRSVNTASVLKYSKWSLVLNPKPDIKVGVEIRHK